VGLFFWRRNEATWAERLLLCGRIGEIGDLFFAISHFETVDDGSVEIDEDSEFRC